MKTRILSILVCVTLVSTLAYADDADRSDWIIKTAEEAKDVSLSSTGFSRLTEHSTDSAAPAGIVVLHDDRTPFLSINGRDLWETTVEVRLEMKFVNDSTGESRIRSDDIYREFKVYVDPRTGQVIKAVSGEHLMYPNKPPLPSADTAEWVMRHRKETYHGFPTEPPLIDLVEAMKNQLTDSFTAKEIHVLYLMWSKRQNDPRPVWMIDLRGIDPPWPAKPDSHTPIDQLNHFRTVIDARTGANLMTTAGPHGGGVHLMFDEAELQAMRNQAPSSP